LAAENPDLEEAREALEDIINDGRRASAVLGRVRQLAKKSAPERAPVDVNGAISEVLSLTRQELQRSEVTARTELDPSLPPVLADRIQVQQVVLNLVINGIEAMRGVKDRARVLRVKSAVAPPAAVAVTVEDTGIGFGNNDRITYLKHSSRRRRTASVWGFRSAGRSCRLTADACGRRRDPRLEPPSASPCQQVREREHDEKPIYRNDCRR
jgi:light-regulated signal transduction histidine kinase (bacteriophytochrome)